MSQGIVRANARNAMTSDAWLPYIEVAGQVVWEDDQLFESGPVARHRAELRLVEALRVVFANDTDLKEQETRLREVEYKLQYLTQQIEGRNV